KLKAQIEEHHRALELLELHLGPFAKNPNRIQFLQPAHRKKMEQLFSKMESVKLSQKKLEEKKVKMLEKGNTVKEAWVTVQKSYFPGAVVKAGEKEFTAKEVIKGPCSIIFDFEKKEFTQGEARAVACTWVGENKEQPKTDSNKDQGEGK